MIKFVDQNRTTNLNTSDVSSVRIKNWIYTLINLYRFLSTDVGSSTSVKKNVKIVAWAARILSDKTCLVRLKLKYSLQ